MKLQSIRSSSKCYYFSWLCVLLSFMVAAGQQATSSSPTFAPGDPNDCVFVVTENFGGYICGEEAASYRPTPTPTKAPTTTSPTAVATTESPPTDGTVPTVNPGSTAENPTVTPAPAPTASPTNPTLPPTPAPTALPTNPPTPSPTFRPIPVSEANPDFTDSPTRQPTPSPVVPTAPTKKPTSAPVESTPTHTPTDNPKGSDIDTSTNNDDGEGQVVSTLPQIGLHVSVDDYPSKINMDGLKQYFQSLIESILLSTEIDASVNSTAASVRSQRSFIGLKNITSFSVAIVAPTLTNNTGTVPEQVNNNATATVPIVILLDGTAIFSTAEIPVDSSVQPFQYETEVQVSPSALQEPLKAALTTYFSFWSTFSVETAMAEEGGLNDPKLTSVEVSGQQVSLGTTTGSINGNDTSEDGNVSIGPSNSVGVSGSPASSLTMGTAVAAAALALFAV